MSTDKIDSHYFQQLSALMDGDLPPDQARFLLRRMQHDTELTGCWERWQLCGDALRGQATAPAPTGFAERVALAVSNEPSQSQPVTTAARRRSALSLWGGGALAASIAALALFVVRQQVPEEKNTPASPWVASQTPAVDANTVSGNAGVPDGAASVTATVLAVANAPRRTSESRRSATRNQQIARAASATRSPQRALAVASLPTMHAVAGTGSTVQRDPFAGTAMASSTPRAWPRAVLPQYSNGSGAFNTDYPADRALQTFYPFEPRLPENPPVSLPESATRER